MLRRFDRDSGNWRVEFIQPATPGSDCCVMLYGREGEIVGPLTMALAEIWMDQFDTWLPQAYCATDGVAV